MKKQLWWVAIVALGLALAGQYTYRYSDVSSRITLKATYPEVASFQEVINRASNVVQGEVISVEAGPDNVTKLDAKSGEPNQESRLPTQRITLRVQSAEKGNTSAGQDLVIHRTGGELQLPAAPERGSIKGENNPQTVPPPNPGRKLGPDSPAPAVPAERPRNPNAPASVAVKIVFIDGDPEYQVGEQVFLALEDRPGAQGVQQPVHPAGRYRVQADGALQAVYDDDVSLSVEGRQVDEAASAARGEIEIPTRPRAQKRVTTGGAPDPGAVGMPRTGAHSHSPTDAVNPVWFTWLGVTVIALGLMMVLVSLIPSRRRIQ